MGWAKIGSKLWIGRSIEGRNRSVMDRDMVRMAISAVGVEAQHNPWANPADLCHNLAHESIWLDITQFAVRMIEEYRRLKAEQATDFAHLLLPHST